ncbi:transposase [Streptomyces collinus]
MVGRGEPTDAAWARIVPVLPDVHGRASVAGSPAGDQRGVVAVRTDAPWRDLPERYDLRETADGQFAH